MVASFLTGFFLGISLIMAIGAQNAFVLRQGIIRQHVFFVAFFCSLSDALLICIGVTGISFFFNSFITQYSNILFGLSSIWLASYGALRLKAAFKSNLRITIEKSLPVNFFKLLASLSIITFLNPHVYLDTVILIGSISQQFSGNLKVAFTVGTCCASFIFFFCLAYGAKILTPLMQKTISWRILDFIVAIIMFTIALKLAFEANWL
jgi:L-lysine exporter family protein LysE/ArgO